jgi:hypothetical protein
MKIKTSTEIHEEQSQAQKKFDEEQISTSGDSSDASANVNAKAKKRREKNKQKRKESRARSIMGEAEKGGNVAGVVGAIYKGAKEARRIKQEMRDGSGVTDMQSDLQDMKENLTPDNVKDKQAEADRQMKSFEASVDSFFG